MCWDRLRNELFAITHINIHTKACLETSGFTVYYPDQQIHNIRGLLEKYPTFGREKETGLLGALDT